MSWGCPHDAGGRCQRVNNLPCDPGMKGCVLFGRFVFSNEAKNRPGGPRRRVNGARQPEAEKAQGQGRK